MEKEATKLDGVYILHPAVHGDARGWFYEPYSAQTFKCLGLTADFVQDNHSFSASAGVLRGLHFQKNPASQTKLVRCTRGTVLDVVADLRKGSPSYKQWLAVELSAENHTMLWIPKGFAHGFLTLSDNTEFQYKVDTFYSPENDRSARYDDPELSIDWPIKNPQLSEKDRNAPLLAESDANFTYAG